MEIDLRLKVKELTGHPADLTYLDQLELQNAIIDTLEENLYSIGEGENERVFRIGIAKVVVHD